MAARIRGKKGQGEFREIRNTHFVGTEDSAGSRSAEPQRQMLGVGAVREVRLKR